MAAWWVPMAVNLGVSALGHVMNRGGGRPPKPSQANQMDTQMFDDEMNNIVKRNDQLQNKAFRNNNANTGFNSMAMNRMSAGLGTPGMENSMRSMNMQGQENILDFLLNNENNQQGMINQLMGMKSGAQQFNAQTQNDFMQTQFMARRNDNNSLLQGLLSAGLSSWGAYNDQKKFNMARADQKQFRDLLSGMMQNASTNNMINQTPYPAGNQLQWEFGANTGWNG